jgi:hypothetical protein
MARPLGEDGRLIRTLAVARALVKSGIAVHPMPTPGVPSSHSSHTAPGRGSSHPSHSTSCARQSHHAAPDRRRAHRRHLWAGGIRRVRSGCAEPKPRRPGERARSPERVARPADLRPGARDRRRSDYCVARAGGPPARIHLPRRAPVHHPAAAQRRPRHRWCVSSDARVPAAIHADTEPVGFRNAEPDSDPDREAGDGSLAVAIATLIRGSPGSAQPRAVSSGSGVEQWKLVGLITRRSSVRIRPPQPPLSFRSDRAPF